MYECPLPFEECSFPQVLARLRERRRRLGISPKLEAVVDMLDVLGRPDACYDIIQIAGTNGKTSTARFAAAILAGEGLKSALYTSPDLVAYPERMEIAATPVTEDVFAHGISCALAAGDAVNHARKTAGTPLYDITEFDILTVAALVIFAEACVDVAVLEVGMGGRWDATSATHPCVVGITGIGLDHTAILGTTLAEIAAEKAAIIQRGRRCVLGSGIAVDESVVRVMHQRCLSEEVEPICVVPRQNDDGLPILDTPALAPFKALGTHVTYTVERTPQKIGDPLTLSVETPHTTYRALTANKPLYQAANIASAVVLAEAFLERPLRASALCASVASCSTPGRFDVLSRPGEPYVIVDAAHNPQSVAAFLSSLAAVMPDRRMRPTLLCAVLADKDAKSMARLLVPEFPRVVVSQTQSPRALSAKELAQIFSQEGVEPKAVYSSVSDAVSALCALREPFIAVGSLTLAGEVINGMRISGSDA